MINFPTRNFSEKVPSILFRAEYGIFQDIEHIDRSHVEFKCNFLRMLPSMLKTFGVKIVLLIAFHDIEYIYHVYSV